MSPKYNVNDLLLLVSTPTFRGVEITFMPDEVSAPSNSSWMTEPLRVLATAQNNAHVDVGVGRWIDCECFTPCPTEEELDAEMHRLLNITNKESQ